MVKIGSTYWIDFKDKKPPAVGDKIYCNYLFAPTEKCKVLEIDGNEVHLEVIGIVGFEGEQ